MSKTNATTIWGNDINHLAGENCWICPQVPLSLPFVAAFRLVFDVPVQGEKTVFVHAGERYELWLNGERIGRGSERGDYTHCFCEKYDLAFQKGVNQIIVKVWSLGKMSPLAQMTAQHGLALFPADAQYRKLLATGTAKWEVKLLGGYKFIYPHITCATGANFIIDGRELDWHLFDSGDNGWTDAKTMRFESSERVHLLPPQLPPMFNSKINQATVRHIDSSAENVVMVEKSRNINSELNAWSGLLENNAAVIVPAHTKRRVIIDLNEYYCFYSGFKVSGGLNAQITFSWSEGLSACYRQLEYNMEKNNRNEIENKYFSDIGNIFIADGGDSRIVEFPWWQSGRYIELKITTADEPLALEKIILNETRYPLFEEAQFECCDERLNKIRPLLVRSIQMCSHETYMDCPFWEQLMYVGDTRIEILITYFMTRDHRLPRKSIKLFYDSIVETGLTQSRYPSREMQIIPPFALWWILMVYDYAQWHDEPEFIHDLLTGVRKIIDAFSANCIAGSNLCGALEGWNFYDWVKGWERGVPPGMTPGPGGLMNWHYALTLKCAAQLENYAGNRDLSEKYSTYAVNIAADMQKYFWQPEKGLFSDDSAGLHYSEHSQILALLAGLLPKVQEQQVFHSLISSRHLSRTTIYFSHYLLDVLGKFGAGEKFMNSLDYWTKLIDNGFKTTPERPEPSRSDCHAWGAHPYYHFFASLAGIRPSGFGGREFIIRPLADGPENITGSVPLAQGNIEFNMNKFEGTLDAIIIIPETIKAQLIWNNEIINLKQGENRIKIKPAHCQKGFKHVLSSYDKNVKSNQLNGGLKNEKEFLFHTH